MPLTILGKEYICKFTKSHTNVYNKITFIHLLKNMKNMKKKM